jgi:hypothetical protein
MKIGPLPPKAEMQLEDLFTVVYCWVEESYRLLFGDPAHLRQSNNGHPDFTDAEVLTIALVGELQGEDSQRGWHGKVKKSWRHLFPQLCDRTRYGRRLRRLRVPMAHLQQHLCFLVGASLDRYRVVDSFPLILCHLRRLSSSSKPFEYHASIGYCASKKEYYYGMTLQLLCDLRGIPTFLVCTPAHAHDLVGFEALVQELADAGLTDLGLIVVADKGYVGQDFIAQMKALYGIDLMPIPRHYDKDLPVSAISRLLQKSRRQIETTISQLTDQMHIESTRTRSLAGLLTSLVAKITAFDLAVYFNQLLGEPLLQIKDFAC